MLLRKLIYNIVMTKIKHLFLGACFICFGIVLQAQEIKEAPGEMITDRPDETEAPSVVAKGYLQIETGFFYEEWRYEAYRENEWGYNTTLLRYGLLDNLELRLGADVLQVGKEVNGQEFNRTDTGFSPLLLGTKINIAEEDGLLPEIGFMGHLRLGFAASEEFRTEDTGVDFRFAFSHTISDKSGVSYNVGAEWHNGTSGPTYIYTISYGYNLTDSLGVYAELYGDVPEDESADHFWDAGVTYLLSQNFQLDAFVGTGINSAQHVWAGGGFSYRIPR